MTGRFLNLVHGNPGDGRRYVGLAADVELGSSARSALQQWLPVARGSGPLDPCYGVVDGIMLIVHSSAPPDDRQWLGHIELARAHLTSLRGLVVITLGGTPNATQRKAGAAFWDEVPVHVPLIVVSSSSLVRGVVTALNWIMTRRFETYPMHRRAQAYAAAGATPCESQQLEVLAAEWLRELDTPLPAVNE